MEFSQFLAFSEVEQLPKIATIAEEVGFTGVLLGDHIKFETLPEAFEGSGIAGLWARTGV